ncbi:MAG TPA: anthranilate synthase component 1 [Gemmatimonadales bacterium]
MSRPNLGAGDILPLVRRLSGAPDPLALHAVLTDGGRRPDTLLFESADAATGQGEKSVLLPRTMLRLEGRGHAVRVIPLTANGAALRDWLAGILGEDAAVRRDGETLVADYPPPAADDRDEQARLRAPGPLDALRAVTLRPNLVSAPAPLAHLAAGIFAYDLVDRFERLPAANADRLGFPDFVFWVPEQVLVLDHVHRSTTVITPVVGGDNAEASYHDAVRAIELLARAVQDGPTGRRAGGRTPPPAGPSPRPPVQVDLDDDGYAALVRDLKRHIVAGDVFQIVPSRTFTLPCPDPFAAYRRLRDANPSPYMFFVRGPEAVLLGASPETAVKVGATPRTVTLRPIAGTAPRGRHPDGRIDHELDARLQAALLTDAKELAEHMMLVDLARNDVARVSRPGTRRVRELLTVDRYQHVMHLVSEVEGELAPGNDALHAYAATLNMGTLVGAPKIRAAELLREREADKRGPYGGAVGYLTHDGEMDTAIVIRSALVQDGVAHVRAGAGIVLDSDPAAEAAETSRKAAAVLEAITPGEAS